MQHKATREKVQHEGVQHTKNSTWKRYNTKQVQHRKSTTPNECNTKKGATWSECNMRQHKKGATWTANNTKKVQFEKTTYEKSATRIKSNTKWVQHTKKCDLKRVQHEATREKMRHGKSRRVKYAKKVDQNNALECTNR